MALAVLGGAACSEPIAGEALDTGVHSGPSDAGPLDALVEDAGGPDTGGTDAGLADTGLTDAGLADTGGVDGGVESDAGTPTIPSRPGRGAPFFGTVERFNRYYTDSDYVPVSTIYVSPTGTGSGTETEPASVDDAFARVQAGETIRFLAGSYEGCWQLDSDGSGTYDAPIVIEAERTPNGQRGAHIRCCESGRRSCFNLEGANYVAISGFILEGGRFGVRAVGLGYASAEHQVGIAIVDNEGFDQDNDPFFTGQSDWIAVEDNVGHGAGAGDGHGIYLSNGSDWMVVRGNDLYDNASSDFQINADPASTCADVSIPYDDPRCDGSATQGLGQGVSEFVLVENNYFHDGRSQGPNFTSVRNSIVRNNIIGPYARHGTSFWQETDNPQLGSSDNLVHHNLFIGVQANRHMLSFTRYSDRNDVRNNLFLGLSITPTDATANPDVVLMEVDTMTTSQNGFEGNYFCGGRLDGHVANASEVVNAGFEPTWFEDFPLDSMGAPESFVPASTAPFLDVAPRTPQTLHDRAGRMRGDPTEPGPYELP